MSLSDDELRAFSREHLFYEIEMLSNILEVDTSSLSSQFQMNILLESFGLHLRNLITFLYSTQNQRDTDVYARDYFSDKDEWGRIAPLLSQTLNKARQRANKELGHLTTERITGFSDNKKWEIIPLAEELGLILKSFCSSASKSKLDTNVTQLVSRLNGFHRRRSDKE